MRGAQKNVCRYDGCARTFEKEHGRRCHEVQAHDYRHRGEWETEDNLRREYCRGGRSIQAIANSHGVTYERVRRALKDFGIERRHSNETRYFDKAERLDRNFERIRKLYVDELWPLYRVAERFDVSDNTLRDFLKEKGAEVRGQSEQLRQAFGYEELNDPDWLRVEYREKRRYTPELADEIGCNQVTVYKALLHHDIEIFDHGETINGEQCYNWDGGYDGYYGPNWRDQRERARERDDYQCQACGVHENENGRELSVHHITRLAWFKDRYDAPEWWERGNNLDNLVTVCEGCHKQWEGVPLRPVVAA